MKLFKDTEKKEKEVKESTTVIAKPQDSEVFGLKSFMDKYPNNATTSLVYFEDGMAPVASPFTTIVPLSKHIAESDKKVIDMLGQDDWRLLGRMMQDRRHSILEQFWARVNFLARSLSMNLDQKVMAAIKDISGGAYYDSAIEFDVETIVAGFETAVANPAFSSLNERTDYLVSYAYNTAAIPQMVAVIYDNYDKIIVNMVGHRSNHKVTAEKLHMDILNEIMPAFEMLKTQLEWLFYMIRSEASTIYRPMAMLEAEGVIEAGQKKEYVDRLNEAYQEAIDERNEEKMKQLSMMAAEDGIVLTANF